MGAWSLMGLALARTGMKPGILVAELLRPNDMHFP